MFSPRLFVMVMSTTMPLCVLAAPTTELPPAPSAYVYIVVKYPATPIPQFVKVKKTKKKQKKNPPAFSAQSGSTPLLPPPVIPIVRGRSPFSVDRNQPSPSETRH